MISPLPPNHRSARSHNIQAEQSRYVCSFQKRRLSDLLFYPLLSRVLRRKGIFWFVWLARSVEKEDALDTSMIGRVYVFHDKLAWRDICKNRIKPFQDLLDRYNTESSSDRPTVKTIRSQYVGLNSVFSQSAAFHATACLARDGVITITRLTIPESGWRQRSEALSQELAQSLPFGLSNQAYYFIRDISHAHQHHDPNSDTLLTLCEIDSSARSAWVRRVVFSLYHKCIRMKRDRDHESHSNSLGILAYLISFKKVAQKRLSKENIDIDNVIPYFNDDAMRMSIDASRSSLLTDLQITEARRATAAAWAFGTLGIYVGLIALAAAFADKDPTTDKALIEVASSVKRNYPFLMYTLIAIVAILVVHYCRLLRRLRPVLSDVVRLLYNLNLKLHGLVYIAVGSSIIAIAIFIMTKIAY